MKSLPNGVKWPKISVITPSFNQGRFIETTIQSVINQKYPNLEYIVMDGGSTDETKSILEKYDSSIDYWVSEKDNGQSHALNKGFKKANGDILTWINSDDYYEPNALYAMALEFTLDPDVDLVAGICKIYKDDELFTTHQTSCVDGLLPLEEILDIDRFWLKGKFFYQPEVFFSRRIWNKAGSHVNEDLYYSMDYELWVRFAKYKAKIKVIGTPIVNFRLHEEQKTSTTEAYLPELTETALKLKEELGVDTLQAQLDYTEFDEAKRTLKIAILNDVGWSGGAGIANKRIGESLLLAGHQVTPISCYDAWTSERHNIPLESLISTFSTLESDGGFDLLIIGNLHNIANPLEVLSYVTEHYPSIFIMHDQWLLTGRCAYTGSCEKYLQFCDHSCPTHNNYPALMPELVFERFIRKQELLFKSDKLLVLGNSRWMKNWSESAYIMHNGLTEENERNNKFRYFNLGVNDSKFKARKKKHARTLLGLPKDKFIILTGSVNIAEPRKGVDILLNAIKQLDILHSDICLVAFGHQALLDTDIEFIASGYIEDEELLSYYYSAADIFIGPSREEAFGQTYIEAATCGTPSIAFDVGGISDAIINGVTGSLLSRVDAYDLAREIEKYYSDKKYLQLLSRLSRLYASNNFNYQKMYHNVKSAGFSSNKFKHISSKKTAFLLTQKSLISPLYIKKTNTSNFKLSFSNDKNVRIQLLKGIDHILLNNINCDVDYSDRPFAWIEYPGLKICLMADKSTKGYLHFHIRNQIDNQSIEITQNKNLVYKTILLNGDLFNLENISLEVQLNEGLNMFEINFEKQIPEKTGKRKKLSALLESVVYSDTVIFSKEMVLHMDNSLDGYGWYPSEQYQNKSCRWMSKQGLIRIQAQIFESKDISIVIHGLSFISKENLESIEVFINDMAMQGELAIDKNTSTWTYTITTKSFILMSDSIIRIKAANSYMISDEDSRQVSYLISSLSITTIDS